MDDPDSNTSVVVCNPVTGEVIDQLDQQPAETLADALYQIRARRTELRSMEQDLETELRRRIGIRERTVFIYGDYEISAKPQNESVWDADELETTLRGLLDQGTLHASELTEVIRHETTVNRAEAKRLLTRLQGDARKAVEDCMVWRQKGRARVEVARSVKLIPEEAQS